MLSRYRSVSVVAAPGAYNNPVQRFEEAAEHRRWLLADRAGEGVPGALHTTLRLWDGPLAGIAHQDGQFVALEEGPAGEDAGLPPEGLAQALSLDLEVLLGLSELTRDVLYGAYGSESDFNVVPIILEPRLDAAGASQRASTSAAATAAIAQPPTAQSSNHPEPQLSELAPLAAPGASSAECGGGGGGAGGGGGCGGWWSLAEAVATPLTWEEVAASLRVASELAVEMQPPQTFETKEAFRSHMFQKHISKMEGGDELVEAATTGEAAAPPPATPDDPWVTRPTPAAAGAGAAAAAAAGDEDLARQRLQQRRPAVTAAAALAAAVRELSDAISFPAALQVTLGSEALGWNPVPLLWVGRSSRSGAILGLLTAVVWT